MVLAAAAVAALGTSGVARAAEYARVVSARPVTESVSVPRQECVNSQQLVQQQPSGGGAVVGALVGGLLGNQFGHGFGRAAATGAGAVAGAAVGNSVEVGANPPVAVPTQQCRTVTGQENRVVAYDVVYEYHGQRYSTRLPEDPGPRLAVDFRSAGNDAVEPSAPAQYGAVPPATYGAVPPAYGDTAPIVKRLGDSVLRAMSAPEVLERINGLGQTPSPAGADEFSRMMREDYVRWQRVVKAAGVKAE